jgi:Trypsin-co-occurring domain 2
VVDGKPRPDGTVAGLADAVRALRAELNEAMAAGKDEPLQFEVGTVTMEFAVEITADAEAKGGVRFWVVELGATGSVGRTASHTVTLELTPRSASGQRPLILDEE